VHDGPDGPEAELKRMYVSPAARGRGVARAVLAELERTAVEAGYRRMVLETGVKQPEALALYRSAGYVEVPRFGYYAEVPSAVHLGKMIGTVAEEPSCPSMP
jgi:ribosomal protein S18 acetylase RimI-like enzyme